MNRTGARRALFGVRSGHYATLRSVWLQNRLAEINGLRHRHDNPARETPTSSIPS
jgi:phospholipid-binding lipoprotein MlaA